jgi:uncharacterized protein (DUF1501 family)
MKMPHAHCTRRSFIRLALASGLAAQLPRVAFASAPTDARFVFVILRGALDGLAAVPALGDRNYAQLRGPLAIESRVGDLDGFFALHPSLASLHALYRQHELVVFHATATAYRERSHFDGQDVLEAGRGSHADRSDGWLNRLLRTLPLEEPTNEFALALSPNIPLVLQGDAKVSSWAPSRLPEIEDDTLQRLADLYSRDAYFATRLQSALATESIGGGMNTPQRDSRRNVQPLFEAAGRFLAADNGPRIAVLETTGWDTHANQGADEGTLANRLGALDTALKSLQASLGAAWKHSAVIVATEFGRTVAVNGTRGTDHGTATCAFLLGGAVKGGRVIAHWPGLGSAALYEDRDLQPTLDLRAVIKGVLADHLHTSESQLADVVFPGSGSVVPMEGLITDVTRKS